MPGFKSILVPVVLQLLLPSLARAASGVCTAAAYSSFVNVLGTYAPASSWCSTNYPLYTTIITTVTTTSTKTVKDPATTLVTTTTATDKTIHVYFTSSTTITVTVTAGGSNKQKRRDKRSPAKTTVTDTASAAFSTLQAKPAAFARTVCSCIETPTVEAFATKTSTVLNTVHTAPTKTVVTKVHTTVTESDTTTKTFTVTATVTPTTSSPLCTAGPTTVSGDVFSILCQQDWSTAAQSYEYYSGGDTDDIGSCLSGCVDFYSGTCCGVEWDEQSQFCQWLGFFPSESKNLGDCNVGPGTATSGRDVAIIAAPTTTVVAS